MKPGNILRPILSAGRLIRKELGSVSNNSGRLITQKNSTDGSEAIRVANSQKKSSSADLNADGTVLSYAIAGPSPQGEANTLDVCQVLVQRLNVEGGRWSKPECYRGPKHHVDCVAGDGQQNLYIQVTKAEIDPGVWRRLSQLGNIKTETTVQAVADSLLQSVKNKAKRYSAVQRSEIVLALDAMDTAGHTFKHVISDFQKRHGETVRGLGFKAIWVVGPLPELAARLDVECEE